MTTSSLGLSFLILTMNLSIYSILGSIIGVKLNNIQIKQKQRNDKKINQNTFTKFINSLYLGL